MRRQIGRGVVQSLQGERPTTETSSGAPSAVRHFEVVAAYRFAAPTAYRWLSLTESQDPESDDARYPATTVEKPPWYRRTYKQIFPESGVLAKEGVSDVGTVEAGSAILHVMMEVEPASEADFNAWYNDEHLMDMLQAPGVRYARRFRALETPNGPPPTHRYLAVYEFDDEHVVDTQAYLDVCQLTPWMEKLRPHIQNSNQLYREVGEPGLAAR